MRFGRFTPCVAMAVLILAVLASPSPAQRLLPPATQRRAVPASRPKELPAFPARGTSGPSLPVSETEINGKKACACEVYGPVWDGVNEGLWIVLRDWTAEKDGGKSKCTALLIDPATGKEKRRLDVPTYYLLGHDGVGLWLAADGEKGFGSRCLRVRTAPGLTTAQESRGLKLPEDVAPTVPTAGFNVILTALLSPRVFQFSEKAPAGTVFGLPWVVSVRPDDRMGYLSRWYFDTRTMNLYGAKLPDAPVTLGGGYVWALPGRLQRIDCSQLKPLASPLEIADAVWSPATRDPVIDQANGQLTWDGERLWSSYAATLVPGARRPDRIIPGTVPASKWTVIVPPVQLVSIDVGLTRKPDTTARHDAALAFEKKNGTLKALPFFEEIIASDPAAAEVRNHLAWALGTRPKEPYHDIQRAKKLVEIALEWQPWDPEKWDTLAEITWRFGDAKLAEHLEAKAINLNPNKAFYWKQLDKFRTQPGSDEAAEPAY